MILLLLNNLCSKCPPPVPTQKRNGVPAWLCVTVRPDRLIVQLTREVHSTCYGFGWCLFWWQRLTAFCWWKGEGGCCILRWSSASRINFRLQVSAASWIHLSARWRISANCSARTRLAQLSIALVSLRGTNGPKTLRIWTQWIIKCGELCWRHTTICNQSQHNQRSEVKVAFELIWKDLPLEPINNAIKNFTKRLRTRVCTAVRHIEHKLWSTIKFVWEQLFEMWLNKIAFCCVTYFWPSKNGLTKSDITFVPFEICCWNLAVIRRYELPLSLWNVI